MQQVHKTRKEAYAWCQRGAATAAGRSFLAERHLPIVKGRSKTVLTCPNTPYITSPSKAQQGSDASLTWTQASLAVSCCGNKIKLCFLPVGHIHTRLPAPDLASQKHQRH